MRWVGAAMLKVLAALVIGALAALILTLLVLGLESAVMGRDCGRILWSGCVGYWVFVPIPAFLLGFVLTLVFWRRA